jgi:transcriptional regulator with XRE-family HTH domain
MPKRDETLAVFGRNVANFRNERGYSQDKLAEGANLDRTYLSGIERGVRNPGIKMAIKLARVLNANLDARQRPSLPSRLASTSTHKLIEFALWKHPATSTAITNSSCV